ncbi:MAG: hypothetical protein RIQ79_2434 [Verrucomicrobiota bacterium]
MNAFPIPEEPPVTMITEYKDRASATEVMPHDFALILAKVNPDKKEL